MKIQICRKAPFAVIGKEGSTNEGEGFIQSLWDEANAHFQEVEQLAQRDGCGNLLGIWGAMSDFSRTFNPWEDFSRRLPPLGKRIYRRVVSRRRGVRSRCGRTHRLDKMDGARF